MADYTGSEIQSGEAPHMDRNCGVTEEQFPHMGKCCDRNSSAAGVEYRKICHCCSVWTSPPDGGSLEVATIFECGRYGYARRVKE